MKRSKTKMTDIMNSIINAAFSFIIKPMQLLYGMQGKYIYILLSIVLIFLFAILYPYNTINKKSLLDNFISNATTNNAIDVQLFWKVREFMSPGHLELDKTKQYPNPFLIFTSKNWQSSEYLAQSPSLDPALADRCTEMLLTTSQDLICNLQ